MKPLGQFIISLDFELFWGVRDKKSLQEYGNNIKQVWEVIPRLVNLFQKYNVSATFATVGFLFASNRSELLNNSPDRKPDYVDKKLSPYINHIPQLKSKENKYHFASQLIELIASFPDQEIGTHTFSHYYCLEEGQSVEEFEADIRAAIQIASKKDVQLESLVFPRNQYNERYIEICKKLGILCYRGNENTWFYRASSVKNEGLIKRGFRLTDAYFNISGHHTYCLDQIKHDLPLNIPASRFLRPYSPKLRFLESLKVRRIKKSMTYAAKKGEIFHLWWHPHNFGSCTEKNFKKLQSILNHYQYLNEKYQFRSTNMAACAKECLVRKQ